MQTDSQAKLLRIFVGESDKVNHVSLYEAIVSAARHAGLAGATARQRSQTLEAARQQHPTRFATTHDPKILELPASAWINEPRNEDPAA